AILCNMSALVRAQRWSWLGPVEHAIANRERADPEASANPAHESAAKPNFKDATHARWRVEIQQPKRDSEQRVWQIPRPTSGSKNCFHHCLRISNSRIHNRNAR